MKLGSVVNDLLYPHWQFVEGDLHDIHNRVTEYDAEAKLARDSFSGQLGLARKVSNPDPDGAGHCWLIAKRLIDPETDEPLTGEPDKRVLDLQREADAWRVGNLDAWRRTADKMWQLNERARLEASLEENMEKSEEFVWTARRKDLGHAAPVSVPKELPANG